MEPWANSVMDDISATISPMRAVVVFAFIISIYRKYAYYIIIRVARGELFLFFCQVGTVRFERRDGGVPRVRREGLHA